MSEKCAALRSCLFTALSNPPTVAGPNWRHRPHRHSHTPPLARSVRSSGQRLSEPAGGASAVTVDREHDAPVWRVHHNNCTNTSVLGTFVGGCGRGCADGGRRECRSIECRRARLNSPCAPRPRLPAARPPRRVVYLYVWRRPYNTRTGAQAIAFPHSPPTTHTTNPPFSSPCDVRLT